MRDIALARLTGAPCTSCICPRPVRSPSSRAAKAGGMPVTAEAAPHHFTLTDEACAGYDPVFKVNPPLRTAPTCAVKRARWSTAPSTPSPPTTRRTRRRRRSSRSTRPRPACSGSRPRWPSRSASSTSPIDRRAGPAVVATRGDRRACAARTAARSWPARQPTSASSTPRPRGWSSRTRLASRSRNTPYAGRKLTGRVRHTVLAGRARRRRRRGAAVSAESDEAALLVLADGTVFEGEAIGADPPAAWPPARSCSTR